jgi:hypothetical protein
MTFSRSPIPFFNQRGVSDVIEAIASQDSLVIYAGAGVSIDKTGLTWAGLGDSLLKSHMEQFEDDLDGSLRAAIMHVNNPLQAASIVLQKFEMQSGAEARSKLATMLRMLFYVARAWQPRSALISAIVQLTAAFSMQGKDVYIVTTNYDEFIQREAELQVQAGVVNLNLATSVVDYTWQREGVGGEISPYHVIHLHGLVSKGIFSGMASDLVLSETDYFRSERVTSAVLAKLFTKGAVLILGSSLTDRPLLEALAITRSSGDRASDHRFRIAVTAMQSLDLPGDAPRIIDTVQNSVRLRMRSFGTDVLFTDFYCEIPQLLTEAQVRMVSKGTQTTHGQRLERWWSHWWQSRSGQLRQCQNNDHEDLERTLADIPEMFGISHELLKLEVWIRWEPGDPNSRHLRRWASSTGTSPDMRIMRTAEIAADSSNMSVRAFCLGRPEIYPPSNSQLLASSRWQTYLCVPISVRAEGGELPVAVVSLASMTEQARSKIHEANGSALGFLVRQMMMVGQRIAT